MQILIVDDEIVIRNGLKHMMMSYCVPFTSIRLAENGEQALAMIAEIQPDLIMTDIRMPKMDGLELSRRLQESYPYITVIVISGFAEFDYAKKCMAYGVKDYLLKPVVKDDIHQMLDKVILSMDKGGVIAPSQSKKWLDEMTELIWELRPKEVEQCLEEWLHYCRDRTEHPDQLRGLLEDSYHGVLDRLRDKGHIETAAIQIPKGTFEEVMNGFREPILALIEVITSRRGGFKDMLSEAKGYIMRNISKEVTLEEVANLVGLTPNYFSMYFKKMTGVTFIHYRMMKRMETAEQLLAIPHYRIVDVAHEVGYEDYSHFAKTFRKVKGLSPTEFRSRLGIK